MAFAKEPKGDRLFEKHFPAAYFTSALRMLNEKSLLAAYQGKDIVRLTRTAALGDEYFTIRIEKKTNDVISVVYKETHRLYQGRVDTSATTYSYDRLEFDSTNNEYQIVSYARFLLGTGPYRDSILVSGRKAVNPIARQDTMRLNIAQWNQLIGLINRNAYVKLSPVDTAARVDGHDYLLELHTKDGYYVVDRFVPSDKVFLEGVDFILNLVGKRPDE